MMKLQTESREEGKFSKGEIPQRRQQVSVIGVDHRSHTDYSMISGKRLCDGEVTN